MTKKELKSKMLAFIESQDNSVKDEWYGTNRYLTGSILEEFAKYLDIDLELDDNH